MSKPTSKFLEAFKSEVVLSGALLYPSDPSAFEPIGPVRFVGGPYHNQHLPAPGVPEWLDMENPAAKPIRAGRVVARRRGVPSMLVYQRATLATEPYGTIFCEYHLYHGQEK